MPGLIVLATIPVLFLNISFYNNIIYLCYLLGISSIIFISFIVDKKNLFKGLIVLLSAIFGPTIGLFIIRKTNFKNHYNQYKIKK